LFMASQAPVVFNAGQCYLDSVSLVKHFYASSKAVQSAWEVYRD
jgi:hypothetical protein